MYDWKKVAAIAVELMVTAIIIVYANNLNSIRKEFANNQQNEVNAIEISKEYRVYNRYDNTIIYAQDMVSALLEFRGEPHCRVITIDDKTHDYYTTAKYPGKKDISPKTAYNTETLQSLYITANNNEEASRRYKCSLTKNDNGEIAMITFKAVK